MSYFLAGYFRGTFLKSASPLWLGAYPENGVSYISAALLVTRRNDALIELGKLSYLLVE